MENRQVNERRASRPGCGLVLALGFAALLPAAAQAQSTGPDVTVFDLMDTNNYGASGGIRGYAIGTRSCNIGNQPLNWCDNERRLRQRHHQPRPSGDRPEHLPAEERPLRPDRRQLAQARFPLHQQQLARAAAPVAAAPRPRSARTSWASAAPIPTKPTLNGGRPLGRKLRGQSHHRRLPLPLRRRRRRPRRPGTSGWRWPKTTSTRPSTRAPPSTSKATTSRPTTPPRRQWPQQRLLPPGDRRQLAELQPRDGGLHGAPEVGDRGVADRRRRRSSSSTSTPPRSASPIERFHVARKVTDLGGGVWHYEYAIHNMNSNRAADELTIEFGEATTFTNVGFPRRQRAFERALRRYRLGQLDHRQLDHLGGPGLHPGAERQRAALGHHVQLLVRRRPRRRPRSRSTSFPSSSRARPTSWCSG